MKNAVIEYTTVRELKEMLDNMIREGQGDYPICIQGVTPIFPDLGNTWYDGGYVARSVEDSSNYLTSKNNINFPANCIHLLASSPDMLNGRTEREFEPETWQRWCEQEIEERQQFGGEVVKYKTSKVEDLEHKVYPSIAYLEGAQIEASGTGNMLTAKAYLLKKYEALKMLEQDASRIALYSTSPIKSEREAANLFIDGFRLPKIKEDPVLSEYTTILNSMIIRAKTSSSSNIISKNPWSMLENIAKLFARYNLIPHDLGQKDGALFLNYIVSDRTVDILIENVPEFRYVSNDISWSVANAKTVEDKIEMMANFLNKGILDV